MRNNILEFARQLIQIESTKENKKALDEILEYSQKILKGFTIEKFNSNTTKSLLIYSEKKRPSKFKVILNAHLDVVPAKANQFKTFIKNGKLYGRGAYDMKSAAAVEIIVFKELANKLSYPLGLQLVTDEEIGGFDGTKYQVDHGVRADFMIAGEGTDLHINNKTKGIVWAKIITKGEAAHGAYIWNGKNSILEMKKIIENILHKFPVPEKEAWKTTANIASIDTTNKTFNKVPDECTLFVDVRFIPEDSAIILGKLKSCLTKNSTMQIVVHEPAEYTPENNAYIKILKKTMQKKINFNSETISKHGGSDVRHFIRVGNLGVSFGPIGAGLHTDEEYVDINSLEKYYHTLKSFLQNLS